MHVLSLLTLAYPHPLIRAQYGAPSDYDEFATIIGDDSWSWKHFESYPSLSPSLFPRLSLSLPQVLSQVRKLYPGSQIPTRRSLSPWLTRPSHRRISCPHLGGKPPLRRRCCQCRRPLQSRLYHLKRNTWSQQGTSSSPSILTIHHLSPIDQ